MQYCIFLFLKQYFIKIIRKTKTRIFINTRYIHNKKNNLNTKIHTRYKIVIYTKTQFTKFIKNPISIQEYEYTLHVHLYCRTKIA